LCAGACVEEGACLKIFGQANGRVTFFTRKGSSFLCRQKFRFQALPQYLNIAAALQSLDLRLHGNDDSS